jgi:hypothetical protein
MLVALLVCALGADVLGEGALGEGVWAPGEGVLAPGEGVWARGSGRMSRESLSPWWRGKGVVSWPGPGEGSSLGGKPRRSFCLSGGTSTDW